MPGINEAVVRIGKTNLVVLLNALIASNESAEAFFQTGSETVDPKAQLNYRHLAHLANYHSKQIEMVADIAAEAGLHNHGLHFEITNEKKFKTLLKGLSQTEGFTLDEKAKSVFNDIINDMTFFPPLNYRKISMNELNESLGYLEKFYSLGLPEIKNWYTQRSIKSEDVISSLKELQATYSDEKAFEISFEKYEKLIEPIHTVE